MMALEWADIDLGKRQLCVRALGLERPHCCAQGRSVALRTVDGPPNQRAEGAIRLLDQPAPAMARGDMLETGGAQNQNCRGVNEIGGRGAGI